LPLSASLQHVLLCSENNTTPWVRPFKALCVRVRDDPIAQRPYFETALPGNAARIQRNHRLGDILANKPGGIISGKAS